MVYLVILLAQIYNFYNGANDRANAIATTVATRALSPFSAIVLSGAFNMFGALITTRVAKTIGKGIVPPEYLTQWILVAGLAGAIFWVVLCTKTGVPISVTHALVGGLMGAGIAGGGFGILNWSILINKVFLGIALAPILGFFAGGLLLTAIFWALRNFSMRKTNKFFRLGQIFSASLMSFSHGMNDTQNAMGVITASLLAAGLISTFEVPLWVIFLSGVVMALGTFFAGFRVMKTLGWKIVKLQPIDGFSAESGAAAIIALNSFWGMPVSTTHVIGSSILGVGAVRKISGISLKEFSRMIAAWIITNKESSRMIAAWIITIPCAAFVGFIAYFLINLF